MIRQANRDDWDSVSDISARSGYDDYINAHHGPAYLDNGDVYVIVDQTIRGFIKLEKLDDGSLWFSGLRVSPESRRAHMGTKLLDFALNFASANGLHPMRCLVETGNYPSIRLMDSYGMRPVAKFYFFLGGIDISDYAFKSTESGSFINKQWKFVRNNENVFRKGGAQIALYKGALEYYTALSGKSFRYTGTGTTCAPAGIARYVSLPPDPEFPSGYIFEKQLHMNRK
ncbi:MAG: GNAT family N-acetyltransferase [Ferroplasma sp.]|uniref:GNAT family N-acetyltransferase n=1 Tax=Ferroplasma sp. TaxID=2591003 RepID=UPI002814D06E|nr:GNAT family N-acetyltransferase [Ferroplasma sp.]WMT50413.1 MAG: GNAT family N-acetyltransferase [Ferroplasma sp.]